MKAIYRFIRKHSELLKRIFFFLITAFLIVYQLPKEYKFRYEYQKGTPWLLEDLIAPYDFPIYKLPAKLSQEKDSLEKTFYPYFIHNDSLSHLLTKDFSYQLAINLQQILSKDSLQKKWSKRVYKKKEIELKKFKDSIKVHFSSILNTGIIENSEQIQEMMLRKKNIRILQNNNIAQIYPVKTFYTSKTAYVALKQKIANTQKNLKFSDEDIFTFLENKIQFENYIQPNLLYDRKKTQAVKQNLLAEISPTQGLVQKGEAIILKGEIVTKEKFRKLESFRKEFENGVQQKINFWLIISGQTLIVGFILILLFLFIIRFRLVIYKDIRSILFILFLLLIEITITNIFVNQDILSVYIIPFVLFPLLIKSYFDARTAIFYHTISILLSAFIVANAYEFIMLQYFAGFLAILSLDNMSKRSQLIRVSFIVFLSYLLIYIAFASIYGGSILSINQNRILYFAISALLLLLSYPLIYFFEKIFGFISDLSLIELSDTNHELLRKLAENAPGTFQHSLQVANLAEEAIRKIRGDTLLVRVGALYHDIGKLHAPEYFTENQLGSYNPHSQLSCEESAQIIIKHITEGVKMAEKAGLPEQVIDFIRTHHGTTRTEYFYRTYQNKFPDKEINKKVFTYPGPSPFSKETAVLMMADSVEAASRSLKEYTNEGIDKFVDKIINSQIKRLQFDQAPISFKNISLIKKSFKSKLKNIYHTRIPYPEEKKQE